MGPSSSHTSGVVRIAHTAMRLLGGVPDSATITFYNSFAYTYRGHASDRAAVGGLFGYQVDDLRIRHALQEMKKQKLPYTFKTIKNAPIYHPNTLSLDIKKGTRQIFLRGSSRGGGRVLIEQFQDYLIQWTAMLPTLVICAQDVKGSVAHLSSVLSHNDCNIATMHVARVAKDRQACLVFEIDSTIKMETLNYMRSLPWVKEVNFLSRRKSKRTPNSKASVSADKTAASHTISHKV